MKRRDFIKNSGLLFTGAAITPTFLGNGLFNTNPFTSNRPPLADRTFTSKSVEKILAETKAMITDPELAWMFENCFPNTLDTTVDYEVIDGKPDTFIITGDIDAMWLRDSTAQVWPYMPFINEDAELKDLVAGLVNRQVKCIHTDPYANAFYKDLEKESEWSEDLPETVPGVHERKWEIDSLCYFIRLSKEYYDLTGDTSVFDEAWDKAGRAVYDTFVTEQRKDGTTPYEFVRRTTSMIDGVPFNGKSRPIKPVGLICSAFRPSDDSTNFPFLIPSNIFAVISLNQMSEIYSNVYGDVEFASMCLSLSEEVNSAIEEYAIAEHLDFGKMYAYEVDGFGNKIYMDDANVPSLMSLAYLNPDFKDSEIYQNTRSFLLSDHNPYFLKGKAAEGQASPHSGKESIWPMGIILRAMTSEDPDEIRQCLAWLKATHADTGFMHESFHKDDPFRFTRSWFAWANTLFGELIVNVSKKYPEILSS